VALSLAVPTHSHAFFRQKKAEEKEESPKRLTAAELQSMLMSYSERYAMVMTQAAREFAARNPSADAVMQVRRDMVLSMSAAMIIAAEPNPDVALLDMIVFTVLGRRIYEEHWRPQFGPPIDEILEGFGILEEDIWEISEKVISEAQAQELLGLITEWREKHPKQLDFTYLRFGDFDAERKKSTLVAAVQSRGLLAPVSEAAKQLEETRMLAERAVFLGTRLPLLGGQFMNLWLSQWLTNPQMKEVLADVHTFSESAARFRILAEGLPDLVAREREAAINQLMDRVAKEREAIVDLLEQEEQLRGALADLKETMTAGHTLVASTETLVSRLGFEPGQFGINDTREILAEASVTARQVRGAIEATERLMSSPDWERIYPLLDKSVGRVGDEGEGFVDYTFRHALWLIVIVMVGLIPVRLISQYLSERLLRPRN
jgi:hypothetical protein